MSGAREIRPEESLPGVCAEQNLARRARQLARGLSRRGIGRGATVAIACCSRHIDDAVVAMGAVAAIGACRCLVIFTYREENLLVAEPARIDCLVACAEGVQRWRASGRRGYIIGDALGVTWWAMVERAESGLALTYDDAGNLELAIPA